MENKNWSIYYPQFINSKQESKDINDDNGDDILDKFESPIMGNLPSLIEKENNNQNDISNINTTENTLPKQLDEQILPKIVNIISTFSVGCPINLKEIARTIQNSRYDPHKINAVIVEKRNPRTTAIIFNNGGITVSGAKSEIESKNSAKSFAKDIKKLGYNVIFRDFKVQNVVGTCNANFEIPLSKLSLELLNNGLSCHYEPEIFPGLTYHMQEPKICLKIFSSGKINFVGAKKSHQIFDALNKFLPFLKLFQKKSLTIKKDKLSFN